MSARPAPQITPTPPPPTPVARPFMPVADMLLPYLKQMDEARWYTNFGPLLDAFEARLAKRFQTPASVVTASSGTLALTLALRAMGAAPGRLCAMPSWTFVATAHAAVMAGLRPWFLDVDPETWMLDPDRVQAMLERAPGRVAAAIPVAAFGRPPNLEVWRTFRERTGVPVLIDAAAAFDSLDTAPVPAVVSLHATKALGVGEGGFLASADADLVQRVRERTTFGFRGTRESLTPATNAKLSEYAAAVGLASLDEWPQTRRRYLQTAQRLRIALLDEPKVIFQPGWGAEWVSSTCVVRLPDGSADAIELALAAEGIETRRWWGAGCHACRAFAGEPRAPLPETRRLATSTLGLPFALDMDDEAIGRTAGALIRAVRGGSTAGK